MSEVKYSQGMTEVWSDGEKITINNAAGIKWVRDNIERIFGKGEWDKIKDVVYMETDYAYDSKTPSNRYECVSGYIPQRVIDDLVEELPEDVKKENALDALKEL
jgi:hypothetical protein